MIDLELKNYIDWYVKPVMKIKKSYGYRVVLKYQDGSEKVQQKSGYKKEKDAKRARNTTIGELHSGHYVVYDNLSVKEFFGFWLEEIVRKRTGSYNTYYSYSNVVKNHIIPAIGNKKMTLLNRGDVQSLYKMVAEKTKSAAKQVKTIMNISFACAVNLKIVAVSVVEGVGLPKTIKKQEYHNRRIDVSKTLTFEQIHVLLEQCKETSIQMQILFNVLMGLRCSEIIGLKYTDIDYINRTLRVERQLGRTMTISDEELAPKTYSKQEIRTKTRSSVRTLPIPDYVFEAILEERKIYERNRQRHKGQFQDLEYICCSSYGRPRSRNYHWVQYKKLLADNGLPDIRWHDLRSTYCTLLLKNDYNPKAVSKLMGHAKEIITMDIYGDNKNIIAEEIPELEEFIEEVLPKKQDYRFVNLLEFEVDISDYLPVK